LERYLTALLPDFVDLAQKCPTEHYPKSCRWNEVSEGKGDPLQADETTILSSKSAPKVRALFKAGRSAARQGITQLGFSPQAILRHDDRSPVWPKAIVGSISHTEGLAMAVVGPSSEISGLGIDIEKIDRKVSLNLAEKFAQPTEAQWVNDIHGDQHQQWRLLRLLSAKEATFKTFYPLQSVYLGFLDVILTPNSDGFSGVLLKPCSTQWQKGSHFDISQSLWNGYLVSTCWIKNE
jgi:enterobactin synthetase component D